MFGAVVWQEMDLLKSVSEPEKLKKNYSKEKDKKKDQLYVFETASEMWPDS